MTALKKEKDGPSDDRRIDDDLEILGIFKGFLQRKEKLWLWQKADDEASQRIVHYGIVKKIDPFKKLIELRPNNSTGFKFTDDKAPIFLYSSKRCVALKTLMREYTPDFISFSFPKLLNAIKGDLLQNLQLVEKENESLHVHERQAPRVQAKGTQFIGMKRILEGHLSPLLTYELYDISQGGMAFEVYDPAEFAIADKIQVLSIDGKPLPKTLHGKVVSVRQLPDADIFKIGVQFVKEDGHQ